MKINSSNILNYIQQHNVEDKIFLLYGNNFGLLDEICKQMMEKLDFNLNDPFSNVKISASQFMNNENILIEELSTLTVFQSSKNILLDIRDISSVDTLLKTLQRTFSSNFKNYKLIIIASHIKSNSSLIKFFNNLQNCLLVPCYEEDLKMLESKVKNYLFKNNIKLNKNELSSILLKLSKDSKINKNLFEKLDLLLLSEEINASIFCESFDDNLETDTNILVNSSLCGEFTKATKMLYSSKLSKISSTQICRKFLNKLKLIETLLTFLENGVTFENAISKSGVNVFFKEKDELFKQTKIWNKKSVCLSINKFLETEIKCKLNSELDYNFIEVAMMFIHQQTSKKL